MQKTRKYWWSALNASLRQQGSRHKVTIIFTWWMPLQSCHDPPPPQLYALRKHVALRTAQVGYASVVTPAPRLDRECNIVHTALFFTSMSHKWSTRVWHESSCPQWTAACSAVQPSLSWALMSAPACSSTLKENSTQSQRRPAVVVLGIDVCSCLQ